MKGEGEAGQAGGETGPQAARAAGFGDADDGAGLPLTLGHEGAPGQPFPLQFPQILVYVNPVPHGVPPTIALP